jgi:hypothetical protein
MPRSIECRYCGESFDPKPGKPGYINECPNCLYAKTAPQIPHEQQVLVGLVGHSKEARKAIKMLRRDLLKLAGIAEADVDRLIVELFEKSSAKTDALN